MTTNKKGLIKSICKRCHLSRGLCWSPAKDRSFHSAPKKRFGATENGSVYCPERANKTAWVEFNPPRECPYKLEHEFERNSGLLTEKDQEYKKQGYLMATSDSSRKWYVYIVVCNDKNKSLYCGISKDVDSRVATHNTGKGAKYTKGRTPVSLVCKNGPFTQSEALKVEKWVKGSPSMSKVYTLRNFDWFGWLEREESKKKSKNEKMCV